MPVRTINLKLALGRSAANSEIREAIWTTHEAVNRGVARITDLLLLFRGQEYWTRDPEGGETIVTESEVRAKALSLARAAQEANGVSGMTDEEVVRLLRRLYEDIVPSCTLGENGEPMEGDAQAANRWVSPLMDANSSGNLSVFDKILEPKPTWFNAKEQGDTGWERLSQQWLQSSEALRLLSAPGSPPAWVRKLKKGEPWQDALIADQEKKGKETREGAAPLTRELKRSGLLPLLRPSCDHGIAPGPDGLRIYDRLAMRLAVAHLLSWENWNHRTVKAHASARENLNQVVASSAHVRLGMDRVREYETARHAELMRVSLATAERPFRIGFRTIRGWDRVREKWLTDGKTASKRKQHLAELQTSLRGKFGDPDIFYWLAEDAQQELWRDHNVVEHVARLNSAERELARRTSFASMTHAHARLHPRWMMLEAPGGSNLRNYRLSSSGGELNLELPLLVRRSMNGLTEKEFRIRLAPSGQFAEFAFCAEESGDVRGRRISFGSAHQKFTASLGGAELIFDRYRLQQTTKADTAISLGDFGSVWLKLSVDIDSQAPRSWVGRNGKVETPASIYHFRTALSNRSKHADSLEPGLRVLSVDLGLRTFASCSVFELKQEKPLSGLFFPAADGRDENHPDKLWAVHERSFALKLPGESPSSAERKAREEAFRPILELRRSINLLREILRLSIVKEPDARAEKIRWMLEAMAAGGFGSVPPLLDLERLNSLAADTTSEQWEAYCQRSFEVAERAVSDSFSAWRKETRPRPESWEEWKDRRSYHGGKSIWMLEYLDSVRKLILSWNLRGRAYGQINRQDRLAWGTTARRLLVHLNNLKKDRVKSGADLIVQAARGMVPSSQGVGWSERFSPCRAILFEDLNRYRFRVDRPRRENSQLMKWNHREIVQEVTLQAELYGFVVETMEAGFSSRYLASTGRPGIRCRRLRESDFNSGVPKPYVLRELENWSDVVLHPGALVPWEGGELFATIGGSGMIHLVNADINAAHNLQRRFWGRCGDAYRISCQKLQHSTCEYLELVGSRPGKPDSISLRRLGAMQQIPGWTQKQMLVSAGLPGCYTFQDVNGVPRRKWERGSDALANGEIESPEDNMTGSSDDEAGGRVVLFRDPSGHFFSESIWAEGKVYWGQVRRILAAALSRMANSRNTSQHLDVPF